MAGSAPITFHRRDWQRRAAESPCRADHV